MQRSDTIILKKRSGIKLHPHAMARMRVQKKNYSCRHPTKQEEAM